MNWTYSGAVAVLAWFGQFHEILPEDGFGDSDGSEGWDFGYKKNIRAAFDHP